MTDYIGAFKNSLADHDLYPREIIPDGEIHRFDVEKSDQAGWYVLHSDGIPAGCFGNWKTCLKQNWHSQSEKRLTPEQKANKIERFKQMIVEREAARRVAYRNTREKVSSDWEKAVTVDTHPYLISKQVKPYGLRRLGGTLLIPIHIDGQLTSLQRIYPSGNGFEKRNFPGGEIKGGYHTIYNENDITNSIIICEGYATGASLFVETGSTVVIAFSAQNLKPVAQTFRARYPDIEMIIAGDDDRLTQGNPGATLAREAAIASKALLALPQWPKGAPHHLTDFNDLATWLYGGSL